MKSKVINFNARELLNNYSMGEIEQISILMQVKVLEFFQTTFEKEEDKIETGKLAVRWQFYVGVFARAKGSSVTDRSDIEAVELIVEDDDKSTKEKVELTHEGMSQTQTISLINALELSMTHTVLALGSPPMNNQMEHLKMSCYHLMDEIIRSLMRMSGLVKDWRNHPYQKRLSLKVTPKKEAAVVAQKIK